MEKDNFTCGNNLELLKARQNYSLESKNFLSFQTLIKNYSSKSFRLFFHKNINYSLTIYPNRWQQVEQKNWIAKDSCDLPENEMLFKL